MNQYIGYIVSFFLGMAISDVLWMSKFGIISIWKVKFKTWRLTLRKWKI
jgi:uncharacterized membrane protein (Fun14 family)